MELQDGLGEMKGIRAEGGKKKERENSQEAGRQNDKTEKEKEKWGEKTEKEVRDYGKVEKENPEVQLTLSAHTPNWNHKGLSFGFYKVLLIYIRFHEILLQGQDTGLGRK